MPTPTPKTVNAGGAPTNFGHISYKVPVGSDSTILSAMDSIIASLKKQ